MKKKLIAAILCATMVVSLTPSSFAVATSGVDANAVTTAEQSTKSDDEAKITDDSDAKEGAKGDNAVDETKNSVPKATKKVKQTAPQEVKKIQVTIDGNVTGYDNLAEALDAVNNSKTNNRITVKLAEGTYTANANDQFRIDKENVWLEGVNKNTILDCGSHLSSGQAGFVITSSNVVVKNMTIKSNANKATIKWASMSEDGSQIANGQLHGVTLANKNSVWGAYALNIHGVANMIVGNINVTDAGSNAVAIANAKVKIANSNIAGGSKNDIVFNYSDKPAYKNPVNLTLKGTNLAKNSIYTERPTSAQQDKLTTDLTNLVKVEAQNGSGVFVDKNSEIATESFGVIKDGNEVRYSYFDTAVSKLTNGATLKLYKSAELDKVLWIKNLKDVTIDLNGKSIVGKDNFVTSEVEKYNNNVINVSGSKNLTITNGTLKAGAKNRNTLNITEGSSVITKNVTVEKTNNVGGAPIIVNASDLFVEGNLNTVASGSAWYAANVDAKNGDAKISFKDGSKMNTSGTAAFANMIYCETPKGEEPDKLIENGEQAGILPGGVVDHNAPEILFGEVAKDNGYSQKLEVTQEKFTEEDMVKAFTKESWIKDDNKGAYWKPDRWWNNNQSNPFNAAKIGNYKLQFYAFDKIGNRYNGALGINVSVVDTTKPEISVEGPWKSTLEIGDKYVAPKATVTDNSGEALVANIDRVTYAKTEEALKNSTDYSKEVKLDKVGWYKLRWVAKDSSGNKAYATKVVNVVDTTAPTATIEKDPAGPTNGKVKVTLTFSENVDTMSVGWRPVGKDYTKWYKVFDDNLDETAVFTDENGNKGSKQIVVNNIDRIAPVALLSFDPSDLTNKNVKVQLVANEEVTVEGWTKVGETGRVYEKTFDHNVIDEIVIAKDLAGNETKHTFTIDFIDKNAPTVEYVKFDKETPAKEVTVTVKFSEDVKLGVASLGWKYDEARKHWTKTFTDNGIYTINAKDLAGNTVSQSFEIKNIDRKAPTARLILTPNNEFTNQDVRATLIFDEEVNVVTEGWEKGANATIWTKVFTEKGEETVKAVDLAGNEANIDVKVNNIDKVAPDVYLKQVSTSQPTNESVIVDLYFTEIVKIESEGWEKVDKDGEHWRKKFDKNGQYEVVAVDRAGNKCVKKINIDIIDRDDPFVTKVEYSTKDITKNSVVVKITYSEPVDVAGGEYRALNSERTVWEKVYEENETETVVARDAAGNEVEEVIEVNNIDKIKPSLLAILHNPNVEKTNQDVVVSLIFDEDVTIDAEGWFNDGKGNIWKKVFTENAKETLTAYDLAGNKIKEDIVVEVANIDKVAPKVEVTYSTKDLTNQDVIVTLKYDEVVNLEAKGWVKADKEGKVWEKVVIENGSETVVAKDEVGNLTETLIEVANIDKIAPVINGVEDGKKYDKAVIATVEDENIKEVVINGTVYEYHGQKIDFSKNGKYTLIARDKAGNETEVSFEIAIANDKDESANIVDKNDNNKNENNKSDKTQTGDETNLAFPIVGLLSSTLLLAIIFRRKLMNK